MEAFLGLQMTLKPTSQNRHATRSRKAPEGNRSGREKGFQLLSPAGKGLFQVIFGGLASFGQHKTEKPPHKCAGVFKGG